ncbi:MAG: DegQ family serine endoprotease [Xanthomonadaceae bacterium]|nr:DegQ family serine endoprotease [Xanthomonadaceae bacterium]
MRRPIAVAVLTLALAACAGHAAPLAIASGSQQGPAETMPSLAPMLERVLPAVVSIAVRGTVAMEQNPLLQDPFFRRFFGSPDLPQERAFEAIGSGVIVDAAQGIVITNAHIVEDADELTVTLGTGEQLAATKLGADPETDIAVLKVETDGVELTALPLGDSSKLRVGDIVVAVGNPFGLEQTATSGIVSALGRTGLGIEGYEDFIQTDASINPGNSGGALVNLRGELVGINTAILAPSGGNIGIGFAIPVAIVQGVMTQLVEHGEVRRGQLGVVVQDLTPALAEALGAQAREGAVVTQVLAGSPAEQAGIRVGDVIVSVDGQAIRNSSELRNRIGLMAIDQQVTLGIQRDGKPLTVTPTLARAQQRQIDGGQMDKRLAGALFEAATGRPQEGLVAVAEVAPGSPAYQLGLRPGDRITSVNRRQVENLEQFGQLVKQAGDTILLGVNRRGTPLLLAVQ